MFAPRGWLKRPVPRMMYRILEKSEYFDASWYRKTQVAGWERLFDPVWHYLDVGWKQGLNPSPLFDTRYYLATNPDVKDLGLNPLFHYLHYGIKEQRHPVQTGKQAQESLIAPASPLVLITAPSSGYERISLILDDNSPRDSGAAYWKTLIVGFTIASEAKKRLRILDRRSVNDDLHLGAVARSVGLSNLRGFEYVALGLHNRGKDLPSLAEETFLVTSWSSAYSLRNAVKADRVIYVMADDDTRFFGDSDQGAYAREMATRFEQSALVFDESLAEKTGPKRGRAHSVIEWPGSWSSPRRGVVRASSRAHIVWDMDTRAHGARPSLTLHSAEEAVRSGVLRATSSVGFLSDSSTPVNVTASLTPRLHSASAPEEVSDVARETSVFVTLARPHTLGAMELAVLTRGGTVVTRYAGTFVSPGRLITVEPTVDSVVAGVREALSVSSGVSQGSSFSLRAEFPGVRAWR